MKGLYLYFVDEKQIGVINKIKSQILSLEKLGHEIDIIKKNGDNFYLGKDFIYKKNKNFRFIEKINFYINLLKSKEIKKYDYIYIRYMLVNPLLLLLLKKISRQQKIKLIIEIPTYPYDNEIKKIKITNILDKYLRKNLSKYIDRVVTFSEDDYIWGIKCIKISNGINLEKIKLVEKKEKDTLTFTSVSNCSFWHGIDRFIHSLDNYFKENRNEKIIFNIVGEGQEYSKLKDMVNKDIVLKEKIKFKGFKLDNELDEIYAQTDIGVGSLARHRSGVFTMKALKNREYCAKGLPMIFSENDYDFENASFIYKVSQDEKILDIKRIIEWYKDLKISKEEIREYSKQFSWDIQMKKVIEEIIQI